MLKFAIGMGLAQFGSSGGVLRTRSDSRVDLSQPMIETIVKSGAGSSYRDQGMLVTDAVAVLVAVVLWFRGSPRPQ
jgi:hypothetical protein